MRRSDILGVVSCSGVYEIDESDKIKWRSDAEKNQLRMPSKNNTKQQQEAIHRVKQHKIDSCRVSVLNVQYHVKI